MIPIAKPTIRRKDMDSVLTCMVSDHIGPGEMCNSFVGAVAEYIGLKGGIAVRDIYRCIEILCDLFPLETGDTVALSPLAPSIYTDIFFKRNVECMFLDVDPESGCIHVDQLKKFEKKPTAVIIDYSHGYIPNMEVILEMGIPIIEDLTHVIGGFTEERKCGKYSDYSLISLEPDGIITAGGGALLMGKGKKELSEIGKYSSDLNHELFMPDMNASLGLTQVKAIEKFIQRRQDIAQYYVKSLLRTKHTTLLQKDSSSNVYYSFPVVVASNVKDVRAYARKKGVDTIPAFMDSIMARKDLVFEKCPNARSLLLRCLLFPLYPALSKTNVELVGRVLSSLP
jgi:perosamine synthetase